MFSTLLDCEVNQERFEAGDTIKLKVLVNADRKKYVERIRGVKLRLHIVGEEYVVVHWTDKHNSEDHFERETHPLFQVHEILHTFPEETNEGKYDFPFEYTLAENLPSSFFSTTVGRSSCSIRYRISVVLTGQSFFKENIIWELALPVRAKPIPVPANQQPKIPPPDVQQITFCCCFNKGSMGLGAIMNKKTVSQYDSLLVGVVAENNSVVNIDKMEVKFFQVTTFEARYKKARQKRSMAKQVVTSEDITGTEGLKSKKDMVEEGIMLKKLYEELQEPSTPGKALVTILIRPDTHESYTGKKIQVKHVLEFRLSTSELYTNPLVEQSVKVLPAVPAILDGDDTSEPASVLNPQSKTTTAFMGHWRNDRRQSDLMASLRASIIQNNFTTALSSSTIRFEEQDDPEMKNEKEYPVSYKGILEALDDSFDEKSVIRKFMDDKEYNAILTNLTPEQYGTIVSKVNYDLEETAETLAENLEIDFTTKYIISACRMVAGSHRTDIVKRTAHLAVDLEENKDAIEANLSNFDRMVLRTHFEG